MAIVTSYPGWGKSHNGKACVAHIAGEQHLHPNAHGNGRITSVKATVEELERQRQRLNEIAAAKRSSGTC